MNWKFWKRTPATTNDVAVLAAEKLILPRVEPRRQAEAKQMIRDKLAGERPMTLERALESSQRAMVRNRIEKLAADPDIRALCAA
jgi:hypothetical protein